MNDLDALLATTEPEPVTSVSTATPRRCKRHVWVPPIPELDEGTSWFCIRCAKPKDEARSRRGRQSRNYGNRAELEAARRYGGVKVGHAGGPVDIRGGEWSTQMKTHRRLPPKEWRDAFAKMEASTDRMPRLLLRFVVGGGQPPLDYFVIPGPVWLDWFGKDQEDAA